jgi:hypothetical protein
MLYIWKIEIVFFKQIWLIIFCLLFFKVSSYDSSKSNIGWFVNDISTSLFKYGTFKSISHSVNLALVEVIVEALILIKEVGGKLIFFLAFD